MMSYGLQLDHIAINVKEKMDEAERAILSAIQTFLKGNFNFN